VARRWTILYFSGQEAYHMVNSFMTFERLEDRFLRRQFALESGDLGGILGSYGPPRTWGIEIGLRL